LSLNLGTLTSWNPLGLSRPVMGLLYLYLIEEPGIEQSNTAGSGEGPVASGVAGLSAVK